MAGIWQRAIAKSGSVRVVREFYMNLWISPVSGHVLMVHLGSQQRISRQLLNHFHPLAMATSTYRSSTFVPAAPRFNSAATCCKPAPNPVNILKEIQLIKRSRTSLSTLRSAVAADNDNEGHEPGIRGMLRD